MVALDQLTYVESEVGNAKKGNGLRFLSPASLREVTIGGMPLSQIKKAIKTEKNTLIFL